MSVTETPPQAVVGKAEGRLHGNMGFFSLVFTILAYNGPMVVFLGAIPVAILIGNGIGTPVMILICGLIAALFAVGLVTMGLRLPRPGGFYTFVSAGLGKVMGLGTGYAAMVCYLAANLSAYALGGIGAEALMHDIGGPALPWWLYATVMFLFVSALGYLNIDFSAKILTVFLVLELLLMAAYNVSVISQGGAQGLGLDSFQPEHIFSGSIGIAFLFCIGMFGGFEASVIFREEVKQPGKTVPRATYTVVGVLAVLYALTAWTFINSYGPQTIMEVVTNNYAEAAGTSVREFTGDYAYFAANALLITSDFALALASHNVLSRYLFNLSSDGVLPRTFSQVHTRHCSPHRASVAVSIVVILGIALFAGLDSGTAYARLAGIYAYGFTVLIVLAALAITVFLVRDRTEERRALWPAVATGIAFLFLSTALVLATVNFGLLTGTEGWLEWLLLAATLGIVGAGMVSAAVFRRRHPSIYARIGRDDAGDIVPPPTH